MSAKPAKQKAADAGQKEAEEKGRGWLRDDLPTLLAAIAIALLIRTFLFQSFFVPSDSMLPSLLVGDHVFVNKFVYGAGIPFSEAALPGVREPERGEVVVFYLARGGPGSIYAADHRPELPQDAFIKRLVGLPGDLVEMRNDELYINGEVVPRRATGETFTDSQGRLYDVYEEDLGECRHRVLDDPRRSSRDMAPRRVEPGRYLFLGDNRDNSHDGRLFGTVRLRDLAGPAGLLYWSWDWTGSWLALLNPLTWWNNLTGKTRWSRIGDFVRCDTLVP